MIKVAYKYNIAVTFKQAAQFWNGVFNVSILDVRGREQRADSLIPQLIAIDSGFLRDERKLPALRLAHCPL